jgi:hypothetical protein
MGTTSAKWVVPQQEVLGVSDSGDGTTVEGRAAGAGSECKRGRPLLLLGVLPPPLLYFDVLPS